MKRPDQRNGALRELLWVYVGRSSGLVVNLAFLPLYSRLLGADEFGVLALILSASNLLSVLDLGTGQRATQVLADVHRSAGHRLAVLAAMALSLRLAAIGFTTLALLIAGLVGAQSQLILMVLASALLAAQWQLNLSVQALYAAQDSRAAALFCLLGLSFRAVLGAGVLWGFATGLEAWLVGQALVTAVLAHLCRWRLQVHLLPPDEHPPLRARWPDALAHVRSSKALIWTGLVGAVSTQADKALISGLMSPAELAPYFLATTLATAPLSLLGAPLAGYMQTRFARQCAAGDGPGYRRSWRFGLLAAFVGVALPCAVLAGLADAVCQRWLHDTSQAASVATLARLLLLGCAIGALGYIAHAAVMAIGDYNFQARVATAAMGLQLVGFIAAASAHRLDAMCWTWVAYFSFCSAALAWRSQTLHRQTFKT